MRAQKEAAQRIIQEQEIKKAREDAAEKARKEAAEKRIQEAEQKLKVLMLQLYLTQKVVSQIRF